MATRKIKNREEFEMLMQEVDYELRGRGIPIQSRQIAALGMVAKLLKIELKGGPLTTEPIPGVYEGESLSAHILQWFQNRYGNRLKLDFKNGLAIILLRGDPWLFRFPVIYGEIILVCKRDLTPKQSPFIVYKRNEKSPKLEFNVLTCVQDLPQGLANDLSNQELMAILNFFSVGHQFLNKLNSFCKNDKLAMSALSDFNASAKYCMNREYGLSRWSSLQTSEKLMKYYIARSGETFPKKHDLKKLAELAYKLDLPEIDEKILQSVQCSAGVRYGEEEVKLNEVIIANHNTISIGLTIMNKLFPGSHVEMIT